MGAEDLTWLEYLLCTSGVLDDDLIWFVNLLCVFGVFEVELDLIGSLVIWLILFASLEDDCVLLDESGLLLEVDVLLEVLRL